MNIQYDFESDEDCNLDDKKRYARPIRDGDNDAYYGFGYEYERDDVFPVFVDGLDVDEFFRRKDKELQQRHAATQERRRKQQDWQGCF